MTSFILHTIESLIQLSMAIMIGIYFIFSNTIMASISTLESGADVMVKINKVILNPVFIAIFWLSSLGSLYLVFFTEGLLRGSGVVFFLGTSLVTVVRNVPLNNQLKNSGLARESAWQHYLVKWVFWNHVRSVSAITSGLLLVM